MVYPVPEKLYEVNSRAKETLSKIAKIIQDYKDYDVLIEGNTSNAASKPITQAKAPSIPEPAYQLNSSTQKPSPVNQRP